MKTSRLNKFTQWLGPHDLDYSLLFIAIFAAYWIQARTFVMSESNIESRLIFAIEVTLCVTSIAIIALSILYVCKKTRKPRALTWPRYIFEIIILNALVVLLGHVFNLEIISRTGRPPYLGPDEKPVFFIGRLIACFLLVATVQSRQKKLALELQDARQTNQLLSNQYKTLIDADEEIRGQASRFLHDRVQSEIMLTSSQLRKRIDEIGFDADEELDRAIHQLEKIRSVDLKLISQILTPNIEAEGLSGAVENLCRQYSLGVAYELKIDSEVDNLETEILLGIFRIVEQAVINAITHGPAKKIVISVTRDLLDTVVVDVSDDGPGSDSMEPGTGTVIIDAWVSILNGEKVVKTKVGSGYALQVTFPGR